MKRALLAFGSGVVASLAVAFGPAQGPNGVSQRCEFAMVRLHDVAVSKNCDIAAS